MAPACDQVRSLEQKHGNDLAFVVNHSGGKDSTRMLGFVRDNFPASTTYAVMADTEFEHVLPVQRLTLRVHDARSSVWNSPLCAIRSARIWRWWSDVACFRRPQNRQCTSDLKRGPIEKFIRSLPQKVILNCMGIRAEESNPRAQLSPLTLNRSLSTRQRSSTTGFRSLTR